MEVAAGKIPTEQEIEAAKAQGKTGSMGVALARIEDIVNWGRSNSVWPLYQYLEVGL